MGSSWVFLHCSILSAIIGALGRQQDYNVLYEWVQRPGQACSLCTGSTWYLAKAITVPVVSVAPLLLYIDMH